MVFMRTVLGTVLGIVLGCVAVLLRVLTVALGSVSCKFLELVVVLGVVMLFVRSLSVALGTAPQWSLELEIVLGIVFPSFGAWGLFLCGVWFWVLLWPLSWALFFLHMRTWGLSWALSWGGTTKTTLFHELMNQRPQVILTKHQYLRCFKHIWLAQGAPLPAPLGPKAVQRALQCRVWAI